MIPGGTSDHLYCPLAIRDELIGGRCQSSPEPTHLLHFLKIALSALGTVETCGNQEGLTPKGTLNALGKFFQSLVIWMMTLTWNREDLHVEEGNIPVSFK